MRDDLLDVTADAAALGKPVGNDLAERKMTIPLILALQSGNGEFRGMVERLYAGREQGAVAVLEGIRASGGVEATRATIGQYAKRAEDALADLEDTPAKAGLSQLAGDLIEDAS